MSSQRCPRHGYYWRRCPDCEKENEANAIRLVFCDRCGCTYSTECPTHSADPDAPRPVRTRR